MAKRKRVTPDEREAIVAALKSGKTCREVAAAFNRAPQTISNIAKDIGHEFGRLNVENARLANRAYGAEWRAEARKRLAEEFHRLLDDMRSETLYFNFGGKENTYNEHTMDQPIARDKRDLMQAASAAIRTMNDMDKIDKELHDTGLLDHWFEEVERNADEYADRSSEQTGV